jgi:CheY-like chemotaxis protein
MNTSQNNVSGSRILVVDDDRNTREMLSEILRIYHCDVKCAESVEAALRIFNDWGPTLVLSDLGMPLEDGYDLIRTIRAMPNGINTKAIAITGYSKEEDRQLALTAGYDMYLTKPVDLNELMQLIADIANG